MQRIFPLFLGLALAGCSGDLEEATGPRAASPAQLSAAGGVEESVTGHAENTFLGGELLRNASFSARRLPNGQPSGRFHITLHGADPFAGISDDGTRPVTFDVVCLEVDGNRAWIGGRIVAPKTDPYVGGGDVWYVEDGGPGGPDRVGVRIGYRPELCHTRPAVVAGVSERGELVVRDGTP